MKSNFYYSILDRDVNSSTNDRVHVFINSSFIDDLRHILCVSLELLLFPLQEAVIFKFSNVVCKSFNESWFLFHQCRIKAVKRNVNTLNFNGTVLYPAYNIFVHLQVFKKANGYKPWLVNVTVDGCRFIKKPNSPVALLIFNLFKDFSNFNHSCPYMGSQLVQGFYLRHELLKLPLPSGEYLLAINWLFDRRPQFKTDVYFVFTE
ncbi:uncharacterized protein LOC133846069, partial [Drosophila sulfurigaster albostrigata]|uniref:uncharacterized protein LOC133846069 n=1 Tax=Drosophila sulfurigaster albostrigata TaxID=89887 RepID=UPI002D21AC15